MLKYMDRRIHGLYAIIDTTCTGPSEAAETASLLIEGGARIIQLRAKGLSAAETLKAALEVRRVTSDANALFIVNDRIDIALVAGADGVHLGQDDIPAKDAAVLLKGLIIGISTHNEREAKQAEADGATYISFGPIFPTLTKKDADTPKGLDRLKDIKACVRLPVVAIGGITEASAVDVLSAGADSVAMISELLTATDIRAKTESVAKRFETYYNEPMKDLPDIIQPRGPR